MKKRWIPLVAVVYISLVALNGYYYGWFQGMTWERAMDILDWGLALGIGIPGLVGAAILLRALLRGERIFPTKWR